MALPSKKIRKNRPPKNKRTGKRPPLSAAGHRGRTEAALRESEEKYRGIFENVQDVYYETALDGTVLEVSPSIETMSKGQYHRNDLIGKSMYDFYADAGERQALLKALQEQGRVTDFEVTLQNRDGSLIVCSVLSKIQFNAQDNSKKIVGSMRDITKRKKAEAEILRQRDEISHLTRVATMGELAASLAHEINQPLAAILSNAQAALRFLDAPQAPDLDEVRDALKDIVNDDQRAGNVIKELRTFTKKEEPHREPLDMAQAIEEVLVFMRNDCIIRNVTIKKELSADLPPVLASRVQLQQVIMNLIHNGCEAMMETGPDERTLTVRAFTKDSRNVVVEIADCGSGLKEGMPEKIFEPFFTTKPKGLGIGLTISQSIIKAHGGTLSICNNPDKGATVSFTLPAEGAKP